MKGYSWNLNLHNVTLKSKNQAVYWDALHNLCKYGSHLKTHPLSGKQQESEGNSGPPIDPQIGEKLRLTPIQVPPSILSPIDSPIEFSSPMEEETFKK